MSENSCCVLFERQLYFSSGKLDSHIVSKIVALLQSVVVSSWSRSRAIWSYSADSRQWTQGKNHAFLAEMSDEYPSLELADRQKWVCRSGATGFPLFNQIHLSSTERYQYTAGGRNGSDWHCASANQMWSKKWQIGKRVKWEQCLKLPGIKELVWVFFLFLLLLQRKQKTPNLFRTARFSDCTPHPV